MSMMLQVDMSKVVNGHASCGLTCREKFMAMKLTSSHTLLSVRFMALRKVEVIGLTIRSLIWPSLVWIAVNSDPCLKRMRDSNESKEDVRRRNYSIPAGTACCYVDDMTTGGDDKFHKLWRSDLMKRIKFSDDGRRVGVEPVKNVGTWKWESKGEGVRESQEKYIEEMELLRVPEHAKVNELV